MAIFHHYGRPTVRLEDVIPKLHVKLHSASIKLITIKTKLTKCFRVADVIFFVTQTRTFLHTNAVIAIPSGSQAQLMGMIHHLFHIWKLLVVYHRVTVCIMVMCGFGSTVA